MRKNVIKTLFALLLAGMGTTALDKPTIAAEPEPSVPSKIEQRLNEDESVLLVTPHLGFGYRALVKSSEVDAYVDKTRQEFEGSMPGMKDFMQLGRQLPYFSLGVDVAPSTWHILPKDRISFTAEAQFSTSSLFGRIKEGKTFDANLGAFHFGATPTVWQQYLNFWGSFDLGVKYAPHTFGNEFQFRPTVAGRAGFSYIDTSSVFSFHVNDPTLFEQYGYDTLSSLNINRDSRTDARCRGAGYTLAGSVGAELEYARWVLEINVGYALNRFPSFRIKEHLITNGSTSYARTEDKKTILKHDNGGLEANLTLGYTFPF